MLVIRTDEQKVAMVAALRKQKETAPKYTFFGDNNHEGIDAQIAVIEEEMDEDAIYDRYPNDEEDQHTRDMALDAANWLRGDQDDDVLLGQW